MSQLQSSYQKILASALQLPLSERVAIVEELVISLSSGA